jgi:hypothetical protein
MPIHWDDIGVIHLYDLMIASLPARVVARWRSKVGDERQSA